METKKIYVIVAIVAVIVLVAFMGAKRSQAPSATEALGTEEETASIPSTETEIVPGSTATTPKKTITAPKTTSSATPTPVVQNGVYVVSYSKAGFSPNVLEIVVGKSVRFVNNSDKAMRIFSNDTISPIYTTLNSSKTVGKGGTYDFTFVQKGNWGYHNENNPADTGLVIVK